jgi:hypothetical protein
MGDPVRREGTPEQGAGVEEGVPDESGPRRRPADAAREDEVEADLGDVLELVELAPPPHRPRMRVPPPPPRRSAPPPPPRASTPPAKNERFDLDALVLSVPPAPPLSSPSLPAIRPRRGGPSWGVTLGLAASALVMGGGAAWMLVAREPERTSAAPAAVQPTLEDVRPATAENVEPAVAPPAVEAPAEPALRETASEPVAVEVDPEPRRGRVRRTWRVRRGQRRQASEAATPEASSTDAAAEPSAASAPAPSPATASASSEPSASPASGLPERPSRADVEGAVARVLPAVRACAPGTGLAALHLHFAPTGRATTAQVESRLASPEQRSCMARAARGAEVPPFSGPRLSVRYPVQL